MKRTFVFLIGELKKLFMQILFSIGIVHTDVWLLIIGEWWGWLGEFFCRIVISSNQQFGKTFDRNSHFDRNKSHLVHAFDLSKRGYVSDIR